MYWHNADRPTLRVQPNTGYRRPRRIAVEVASRSPQPAVHWIADPAAVVIGQPAPRLVADERKSSDRGVRDPKTTIERRPTGPYAVGTPAIAVAGAGIPTAIGIQ